jgi:hypothetical protein
MKTVDRRILQDMHNGIHSIPLPKRIPDPVRRGVALETSDLLSSISQRTNMEETSGQRKDVMASVTEY